MLNENNYIDDEENEYVEYGSNSMLHDDVIYETNDNTSEEFAIISRSTSHNTSDCISNRTCSSIENDLEAILYDYTIIINCLMSVRYQRSQSEIAVLSQLLQSIPDFMSINATELEYVCQAAKLLTINTVNQIIIKKCSVLNDWYLCLQGSLRQEGFATNYLGAGSYIGTDLWSKETLISDYDLFSNCDSCKLLVIGLADLEPMNQLNNLLIKTSDEDKSVIAVYEAYKHANGRDELCYVLTKGTNEVLIAHLFANHDWVSADYVEDYFLTRKLFMKSTKKITDEIIDSLYLENDCSKDKFDVLIRWMSQNFSDFENDPLKLGFINEIIRILQKQNNDGMLYTFYECCSNGATIREIREPIPSKDCVVQLKLTNDNTLFYIDQINDSGNRLRNGDVILELDGKSSKSITMEMIKSVCEEQKPVVMSVRNDLLGYHEHVVKDIKPDSVSIHSSPCSTQYTRCLSEQMPELGVLSPVKHNASISVVNSDTTGEVHKRPIILPNFFATLQSGSIGRFFKNPKHYAKSTGSRSNSDVTSRLETLQIGNRDLTTSTVSIARFSRRLKSKRKRRSIGSNSDIIKSFDDLNISEKEPCSAPDTRIPIRINIRDALIVSAPSSSSPKNPIDNPRYFHFMIEHSTTVTEVIVRTLLKLNLSSAQSNQFFLVEITLNESTGMIHQKTLKPETSNLIDRMKEHSRYYLKHRSIFGDSSFMDSEADRMMKEFKCLLVVDLSQTLLVIRLFLRSHRLLCQIHPEELIDHVTSDRSTLKYHREPKKPENRILEYMHLSDFYKCWVITEICREDSTVLTRAATIQYFINLALKAMYVGHIDLFFSIVSGLESIDILRLNLSWDKVPKRDKKLLQNLKTTLDVSGNMRNLRIVHQKISSPLIPVTAMVIKDLTMLEETHPTYAVGTINSVPVNSNLVNFDKMSKMARLARNFTNSGCSCVEDRSRPVRKHLRTCKMKSENLGKLERLLQQRLDSQTSVLSPRLSTHSLTGKYGRKYSFSNNSAQSSSNESLSESVSSLKSNDERTHCHIFEQRMMTMKIERYLQTLEHRVIIDEVKLSEMSLFCEPSNQNGGTLDLKFRNSTRIYRTKEGHYLSAKLSNGFDTDVSEKSMEIYGIQTNSSDDLTD